MQEKSDGTVSFQEPEEYDRSKAKARVKFFENLSNSSSRTCSNTTEIDNNTCSDTTKVSDFDYTKADDLQKMLLNPMSEDEFQSFYQRLNKMKSEVVP